MLRRNGVGTSISLAPVAHPEDAQPNEVSKKRKGQGLPPVVASSKPPARTSFNRRGGGWGTIRGGYRGGKETDVDTSTQYATRGGKSSWRGSRNPSENWPRRGDNVFPSSHDPSSNRWVAHAIPPTPLTAGQTGIGKGKAPIRGGDPSVRKGWHRRDDVMTQRNPQQDRRVSPWGQQPDSGYAQRAVPRPTAPQKVDEPSPAPIRHALHPSLPAKPPPQLSPQLSPQSPPGSSSSSLQPALQDSTITTPSEWYLRSDSPDPKLPPGSLGRKNPQPQPTISMPLPGRLRKLQDREDARGAGENVPLMPPQPETIASLPVASPVHQKPQPKAELSQVPIAPVISKDPLPKLRMFETTKPANDSQAEKLSFIPPEDGSTVYKTKPLSEQRKSHSQPRDVLLSLPPPAELSAYRSKSPSQQHKAPPKPQCAVKSTSTRTSLPPSSKLQPQPPRQSKTETSVPTEADVLSFLPPQSASGAYVPVPLSLQRQSRMSLFAMSPTPELQADKSRSMPPQEPSTVHGPAPSSQQRKTQSDSSSLSEPQAKVVVDLKRSSHSSSRTVAHPTHVRAEAQVPEANLRRQIEAKREDDSASVDDISSGNITMSGATASSTPLLIHDLVTPPPPEANPPTRKLPVTPKKTQTSQASDTRTSNETRTSVPSPAVVVKKEEQLSPLNRSPIKPMRKLVTEAASFYPMPASCDKAVAAYKENRKIFFKENSKRLSALGLKRTKAFFRDDGLVIEWKSDVPVWSDTLKPEENNLATAMQEFLRQSAERSGNKRKRKERGDQGRDGPELSPGAKRIRTSKEADPSPLLERKRRMTDTEDTPSPEKRRKTTATVSSFNSGRQTPIPSSSTKSDHLIATNDPLGLSFGDVTSSKDEPIYVLSSPEASPKATSKLLSGATGKKVPLPTRLHMSDKQNGAHSFAPSTSASNSMSNSSGSMSTGAAGFDSETVKLQARTRNDLVETVPPTASQIGVPVFASGAPPSSKRMIFKPTNPSRTSRVTPTVHPSMPTLPAEEGGIARHSVSAVQVTGLNPVTASTHSNHDGRSTSRAYSPITSKDELLVEKAVEAHGSAIQMASDGLDEPLVMESTASHHGDMEDHEQRDNNSDIYCSEHEDIREDEADEDDESKLAVDFFTRFIAHFDSDRSKLVSAYAKNALFTCRVHDLRPRTSVAEQFALESKLLFHSSHSNASASTVEHGRHRICDRLRTMGPHKFRGSVVWDLAPLPLDSPGHLMFSVHAEVVDPTHDDRHLDHILTVDQTFVLRPRTDDDNAHDETSLSDSPHDGEEWPLVAISHQMTVRESRLLPPDAITNLLPWVAGIGL